MNRPLLVIISGLPATGKSHLGRWLSNQYDLPYFYKDLFKEMMFDQTDNLDWQTSRWCSQTSVASLFLVGRELLQRRIPHILEANFKPTHAEQFQAIAKQFNPDVVQIQCYCDGRVLIERFKQRAESGEMHPGHRGMEFFPYLRDTLIRGQSEPIPIESEFIAIDTTDFNNVDYRPAFQAIEKRLASPNRDRFYS